MFVGVWREWAPSAGAARPFASCSHSSDPSFSSLFLYFYWWCNDNYFFVLFLRSLSRCPASYVQSESHERSGEATKGFLGCIVFFPFVISKTEMHDRSMAHLPVSFSGSLVVSDFLWVRESQNSCWLKCKLLQPASLFHISQLPSSFSSFPSVWWLLYLMHQSILKSVTDRNKHQQRDVCFGNVYTLLLIIQNWQTCFFFFLLLHIPKATAVLNAASVKIPVV